ncbi:hypothetical protein [Photobacterium alginatilyticum]|uniref:Uncharacterized protein n=1 Tax=Photobacterium alginatilyticum TaxID=1775171 RepID=A0ABW9YK97_9GAMM|nr:hypothetical protein [Photobacterium alginatilyticum]NBI53951.1 hypothetical protein [Photobacterium alginatilyticum]
MNIIARAMLVGLISLLGVGCTTIKTNELTLDESQKLKNRSVVLNKYDALPDFPAQTALNVQFGLIGFATAVSNGNDMIINNQVKDPARDIAKELGSGLSENYNVKVVEAEETVSAESDVADLVKSHAGYDYILDVKTLGWGSIYFLDDFDNYKVMYTAHARLIDTATEVTIVEELCSYVPDYVETNDAPSYEQLEDGTGLKRELSKSVDYCVDRIRTMAKLHAQTNQKPQVAVN